MKHSLALVKVIEEGGRSSHYWDDNVFARSRPDIVSHIYREHVETYFAFHRVKDSTKSLWYKALAWLRGLERRCRHRVFTKEPQMDPAWWDKHVRLIVSRRPTGTTVRLTLPLENEIPLFMKALGPHVVAWLLELVDPRKLEVPLRHNLWSIRLCLQRNFFVVAALLCMYSAHRDHAAASKMHDLVHELYAQGSIEQAYLVKTAMNEAPAFFSLP